MTGGTLTGSAVTGGTATTDLSRQLRRLAVRHRRWWAAGCAGLAVWVAVGDAGGATDPAAPLPAVEAIGLALPVQLGDGAAVGLLAPGVRVDVLGSTPTGEVDVIARRVAVVSVPSEADGGLLGGSGSGAGAVVLDVTEQQAIALTTAQAVGPLSVALHP